MRGTLRSGVALLALGALLRGGLALAGAPPVAEPADGLEIMRRVNVRTRGQAASLRLEMILRDEKRGEFKKHIDGLRRLYPDGYRTSYVITAPDHEQGIGLLLSEDPAQRGMWMYFPANRQLLHVASRGLSALASDFSCEDLLVSVPLADYEFRLLERTTFDGRPVSKVEMKPVTERLRLELGFSRAVGWVREDIWLIARAEYEDQAGVVFKTFLADDVRLVDGVWTVQRFSMRNLRARHATEVTVTEIDYSAKAPAERFAPATFHE